MFFGHAFHSPLPANRDKHGRRVMILRVGMWNPDVVTFEQGYCAFYKMAEVLSLEPKTQVNEQNEAQEMGRAKIILNAILRWRE